MTEILSFVLIVTEIPFHMWAPNIPTTYHGVRTAVTISPKEELGLSSQYMGTSYQIRRTDVVSLHHGFPHNSPLLLGDYSNKELQEDETFQCRIYDGTSQATPGRVKRHTDIPIPTWSPQGEIYHDSDICVQTRRMLNTAWIRLASARLLAALVQTI